MRLSSPFPFAFRFFTVNISLHFLPRIPFSFRLHHWKSCPAMHLPCQKIVFLLHSHRTTRCSRSGKTFHSPSRPSPSVQVFDQSPIKESWRRLALQCVFPAIFRQMECRSIMEVPVHKFPVNGKSSVERFSQNAQVKAEAGAYNKRQRLIGVIR